MTQPAETMRTRRRVDRLDAQLCTYENDPCRNCRFTPTAADVRLRLLAA